MFWGQIKTVLLLAALSSLFLLLGFWFGGETGMFMALLFAILFNFLTYFYSDKIILKLYGAKPLDENEYDYVYDIVAHLSRNANIPMPKLWYIDTDMANAFATGRNPAHASVAVTRGLLEILDERELRGVLAHELSHVKNRDILIATIAATVAAAISYLSDIARWSLIFATSNKDRKGNGIGAIVAILFVPFIALLLQLAISRSREYLADESGARISRDPEALADALEKLHYQAARQKFVPSGQAQATTSSLFIVFPFSSKGVLSLFSTHPPIEKRIERLRNMNVY